MTTQLIFSKYTFYKLTTRTEISEIEIFQRDYILQMVISIPRTGDLGRQNRASRIR